MATITLAKSLIENFKFIQGENLEEKVKFLPLE